MMLTNKLIPMDASIEPSYSSSEAESPTDDVAFSALFSSLLTSKEKSEGARPTWLDAKTATPDLYHETGIAPGVDEHSEAGELLKSLGLTAQSESVVGKAFEPVMQQTVFLEQEKRGGVSFVTEAAASPGISGVFNSPEKETSHFRVNTDEAVKGSEESMLAASDLLEMSLERSVEYDEAFEVLEATEEGTLDVPYEAGSVALQSDLSVSPGLQAKEFTYSQVNSMDYSSLNGIAHNLDHTLDSNTQAQNYSEMFSYTLSGQPSAGQGSGAYVSSGTVTQGEGSGLSLSARQEGSTAQGGQNHASGQQTFGQNAQPSSGSQQAVSMTLGPSHQEKQHYALEQQAAVRKLDDALVRQEGKEILGVADIASWDRKGALPSGLQSINMPVKHPQWGQALGQRIVFMSHNNLSQAQITLNPQKLGPIQVMLQFDKDQQVHVSLVAQSGVTRDSMESALPRLKEMMEQAGIQLGSVDIREGRSFLGSGAGSSNESNDAHSKDSTSILVDESTEEKVSLRLSGSTDNIIDYYA